MIRQLLLLLHADRQQDRSRRLVALLRSHAAAAAVAAASYGAPLYCCCHVDVLDVAVAEVSSAWGPSGGSCTGLVPYAASPPAVCVVSCLKTAYADAATGLSKDMQSYLLE